MTETIVMEPICITPEEKKLSLKNRIDISIMEAVDESLETFGDAVRRAAYFQLQNNYNLPKQEIPTRIEEFTAAIEEIFGIGAGLIEVKIIKTLYTKAKGFLYVPKSKDLLFKEYVQNLRHFLDASVTS
jgi:hypothetical protein